MRVCQRTDACVKERHGRRDMDVCMCLCVSKEVRHGRQKQMRVKVGTSEKKSDTAVQWSDPFGHQIQSRPW